MSDEIVDLHSWLHSPPGQWVRHWEAAQFNELVSDVFGFHAVQLGMPEIAGLASNRMPNRWLALADGENSFNAQLAHLACDLTALPFDEASLDLVVLPHGLEWCGEATACLREVERVLRPEGRLVLTGFNPASLWAMRQRLGRLQRLWSPSAPLFLPDGGEFVAHSRLRDWLRLLNFEVETARFGLHGMPFNLRAIEANTAPPNTWLDRLGQRLWPGLGALYVVSAVKRIPGVKMMRAPRRKPVFAARPVAVAHRGAPSRKIKSDSNEPNKIKDRHLISPSKRYPSNVNTPLTWLQPF